MRPFSTIALGVKLSPLGVGAEVATPLARSFNLRGAANFVNIGYGFSEDGANYEGEMHFRSGQAMLDWFPFHGAFHISPGVLIYRSQLFAAASVPAGAQFELGDNGFTSSPADPVHGSATLTFGRSLMPQIMMGWGNLLPRSGRRWSVPFEVGAAYMGHNLVQLNLQGTACVQYGCLSTSDPTIQQSIQAEQATFNEDLKRAQVYPILSTGFAYRF